MMLRENLFTSILDQPIGWTASNASDEMKQASIDHIAVNFNKALQQYITTTMWSKQMLQWKDAFHHSGTGSTKLRAREMQLIYKRTIPEPYEFHSNSSTVLDIYKILKTSIEKSGGKMQD
ncbi:hypothetical protein DS745_21390 [Anaerobacillus alkaliphilus]|uniref:Uncharacterized protein n=1 Tax=Anaerobacillus alkaliphilus TaxID=1548597 RepID=A0A4Q0VLP2_9BACI|nr:hypothetical protein [Anaerobacillus alkaliphilus]RXI96288.1 hypothetical protein DS745_21390 [Anaerobacillus alkaliphilus]